MSVLNQSEEVTSPTNPSVGRWKSYFKAAGMFFKDSGGVEQQVATLDDLSGIASAYLATTFTDETSVEVIHNFGMFPVVSVIDATGEVLIPISIRHNSINIVTVVLGVVTSGTILATA